MAENSLRAADLDLATLVLLVGEATRTRITDAVHAAGFGDVRPAHGYVVQRLIEDRPTITGIARDLGITQQGASKLVVELEALGYVSREPDPGDSRTRRVVLTRRGWDCVEAARAARADLERNLAERVGARRLATTRAVLADLADQLGLSGPIGRRAVRPTEDSA